MKKLEVNAEGIKDLVKYTVKQNIGLATNGFMPTAISVMGEAGIGKTHVIKEAIQEVGVKSFIPLMLSQLDELGDLIGFPQKEYLVQKDNKGKWVEEKVLDSFISQGYSPMNKTRMGYSKPSWLPDTKEPVVLFLDDWTRCSPKFVQAAMEIIYQQEYVSWKLPSGSTVILSENPADGEYNVTDIDIATRSRMGTIQMKFDIENWASWATRAGIDQRCISFALLNNDTFRDHKDINARNMTTFFLAVSGVKDFDKELSFVNTLATTYVSEAFSQMFTLFINNKLDKLIKPKEIFDVNVSFAEIEGKIKELIHQDKGVRTDIAYTITQSIINHATHSIQEDDYKDKKLIKRFEDLCTTEVLGQDLRYVFIKRVVPKNPKLNSLFAIDAVVDTIVD